MVISRLQSEHNGHRGPEQRQYISLPQINLLSSTSQKGFWGFFLQGKCCKRDLGGREKATAAFQLPWPLARPCLRQHRSPGALQTSSLSPRPSRSTCVTGRQKEAAGFSGSARRSGREPALRSPGALPTGDSPAEARVNLEDTVSESASIQPHPCDVWMRLKSSRMGPAGAGGGPAPSPPITSAPLLTGRDKNWGGGEEQQADPSQGSPAHFGFKNVHLWLPWLSFLKPGLTLQGTRREQHLGVGAGGLRPLAVGRCCRSPLGLECKAVRKISAPICPNFCSSDSNTHPGGRGVAKQAVPRSTGYLAAGAPWFITFRCFCTRGSHR